MQHNLLLHQLSIIQMLDWVGYMYVCICSIISKPIWQIRFAWYKTEICICSFPYHFKGYLANRICFISLSHGFVLTNLILAARDFCGGSRSTKICAEILLANFATFLFGKFGQNCCKIILQRNLLQVALHEWNMSQITPTKKLLRKWIPILEDIKF